MKTINKVYVAIFLSLFLNSSLSFASSASTTVMFDRDLPQEDDVRLQQRYRDEQEFRAVWWTMKVGSAIAFAIWKLEIGSPDTYERAERFAPALFIGADLAKVLKQWVIDRFRF